MVVYVRAPQLKPRVTVDMQFHVDRAMDTWSRHHRSMREGGGTPVCFHDKTNSIPKPNNVVFLLSPNMVVCRGHIQKFDLKARFFVKKTTDPRIKDESILYK